MKLKSLRSLLLPCLLAAGAIQSASAAHIWINEFHYDNAGADVGEFVEVAISTTNGSGFTASDYAVEFYNGSNGNLYNTTVTLNNFTTISSPFAVAGSDKLITLYSMFVSGIQNGSPDGLALVNVTNNTVESFLSYEGSFTATGATGIAAALGVTSTDVGVFEDGTQTGTSLAASGFGDDANDFNAGSFILATTATPGGINQGQTFSTIPEPSAALLGALGSLALLRRRR